MLTLSRSLSQWRLSILTKRIKSCIIKNVILRINWHKKKWKDDEQE